MQKILVMLSAAIMVIGVAAALLFLGRPEPVSAAASSARETSAQGRNIAPERDFDVAILVDGWPLQEYAARGKRYIEAREGAEYEIRITNPYPFRVAVALSVDGLNSIDARRTSAWNASKWVIAPYGTIHVSGWQMSSERARRFYFTTERDSYAARLGQTANLGAISAVFFRERRSVPIPITPPRPMEDGARDRRSEKSKAPSGSAETQALGRGERQAPIDTDDGYAATGIGRSVRNDVRFVDMDLESRPAGEVNIRYEYYGALVRLGILPREYPRIDPLRRREGATGFEDRRFSPEP